LLLLHDWLSINVLLWQLLILNLLNIRLGRYLLSLLDMVVELWCRLSIELVLLQEVVLLDYIVLLLHKSVLGVEGLLCILKTVDGANHLCLVRHAHGRLRHNRLGLLLRLLLGLLGGWLVGLGSTGLVLHVLSHLVHIRQIPQRVYKSSWVALGLSWVGARGGNRLLLEAAQNHQRVRNLEAGLAHLSVKLHATILSFLLFKLFYALLSLQQSGPLLNDFVVDEKSLFGLLALLVEDAQVVPDLGDVGVEVRGLDEVLKGLLALGLVVVDNAKRAPVHCVLRVLLAGLFVLFESAIKVAHGQFASSHDVQSVRMALVSLVRLVRGVDGLLEVSLAEIGPGDMLVGLVVVFLVRQSGFV